MAPRQRSNSLEGETDDHCGERERHDPDLIIGDSEVQTTHRSAVGLVLVGGATGVFGHPQLSELALLVGETARVVREIRQNKSGEDSNYNSNRSFYEEKPPEEQNVSTVVVCRLGSREGLPHEMAHSRVGRSPPSTLVQHALHATENPGRQERTEGVADQGTAVEDRSPDGCRARRDVSINLQ